MLLLPHRLPPPPPPLLLRPRRRVAGGRSSHKSKGGGASRDAAGGGNFLATRSSEADDDNAVPSQLERFMSFDDDPHWFPVSRSASITALSSESMSREVSWRDDTVAQRSDAIALLAASAASDRQALHIGQVDQESQCSGLRRRQEAANRWRPRRRLDHARSSPPDRDRSADLRSSPRRLRNCVALAARSASAAGSKTATRPSHCTSSCAPATCACTRRSRRARSAACIAAPLPA
jgi:hypothetical protein